jgi:hypothetical protein
MANPDTETLQTQIEQSAALLIATLSGLSEETARTRPAENRWSVLEIVEHVLLVDARFRARIEEGQRLSAPHSDPAREEALLQFVVDRAHKREAPEAARPQGRFRSVPEALHALEDNRQSNRAFVARYGPEARWIEWEHPRFGRCTGYEGLLIIAGHTRRHVAQIEEDLRS